MKLVLFDCDGTLVDGAGLICATMDRMFEEAGLAPPPAALTRGVIGRSLDLAILELLPTERHDDLPHLVERYKDHYVRIRTDRAYHDPVYDGVPDMIEALAAREDILLGIVTGKSRKGVAAVFDAHGFGHHFLTIRTADDCASKPHPAMVLECCFEAGVEAKDTLVVGDTVYDMEMAVSAGATAIGVDWGYGSVEALRGAGAVAILSEPAELFAHLPERLAEGEVNA